MTDYVYTIDHEDDDGSMQSFDKTFTNRASADSAAAALNAGLEKTNSPVWEGNLRWRVWELALEEDKFESYLPILSRYVVFNPFLKTYEMSWLAENTAGLASVPLPATELHEPTDIHPYYNGKVYGRSIAGVEAAASALITELKAK